MRRETDGMVRLQLIPDSYWAQSDTPSKKSPIGKIMETLRALYPDEPLGSLRAIANRRIHSGGPGQVRWTLEERKHLQDMGFYASSG
jgi:hypothetical protein